MSMISPVVTPLMTDCNDCQSTHKQFDAYAIFDAAASRHQLRTTVRRTVVHVLQCIAWENQRRNITHYHTLQLQGTKAGGFDDMMLFKQECPVQWQRCSRNATQSIWSTEIQQHYEQQHHEHQCATAAMQKTLHAAARQYFSC